MNDLTDARRDINPSADRFAFAQRVQRAALDPPSSPPAMGELAGCLGEPGVPRANLLRPLLGVPVGCPAELDSLSKQLNVEMVQDFGF